MRVTIRHPFAKGGAEIGNAEFVLEPIHSVAKSDIPVTIDGRGLHFANIEGSNRQRAGFDIGFSALLNGQRCGTGFGRHGRKDLSLG